MFGYTEQELLSKKYQEITHPDDLEIGLVLTQQLLAGEIDSCQLQKRYIHKTGRVVWVLLNISLVCDDLGNPLYSISQINDITERKQTDEALRRSEESLRAILQTAMDGFWVADMQGRLVEVNEAYCRMSGYDKLELLNMRIPDLEVVESFEETSVHIQKILTLGGDRFESRHHRKDGSIIDVEISVQFQPLDGGRMVAFLEDISERRRAEKLAAQQSEQLRILYEASQRLNSTLDLDEIYQVICDSMASIAPYDCFFISDFDPETQLITCRAYRIDNTWLDVSSFPSIPLEEEGQGTQSLVIRTGQSMLIHDYQDRRETAQNAYYVHDENNEVNQDIPPDDEITHSALIVPLKAGGALTGVIQVMSTRRNAYTENQLKMLEALALHIASAEQNALLFAQVQAELKERKQAEAELLQAHVKLEQRVIDRTQELNTANQALEKAARLKDEFLASMSHELRTPLTGILGLSEALQMVTYGELNEKQRKALKNIEASGRHLLVLINDILDLSKIEAGRFDLQIEACSLGEICQASLQLTKGLANQKRQKVSFSMEPASIVMMADARRVKQMLVNLLGNAIKFTPYDGCLGIQVRGDLHSHEVRIAIWDEGIGIRAEDLPRLFQPFVQLDNSLSRQYAGTGLGLSLVESLAELHKGRVEVESAFGQGSRFTIVLPWLEIVSHPERRTARGISSLDLKVESSQTAPLVLMADDNDMVLELVSDFLASRNYRVSTCHGGVEFLERLEQVQADIILMDIQMPGMDGIEVIQRIRAHPSVRTAALPVIAVTALAMAGDRERCLEAGANAYLSKPVQLKELAEIIETLCPR
jgi:PAS domain S-box-containing protein